MLIWGYKSKIAGLTFLLLLLCLIPVKYYFFNRADNSKDSAYTYNLDDNDLERIIKRGKLIALTENSSTSYFVYKGETMGYEFEMLNRFAQSIGVELEIVLVNDMDIILEKLNKGEADIAAANLTVTADRLKLVGFTEPLLMTKQVLIQHKPKGWQNMTAEMLNKKLVRDPNDLVGKTVIVRKNSSFYSRLKSLSEEVGGEIIIEEACGEQDTEELINYVANGFIEYTVADENVAMINQTYYNDIDISTPISFEQKIAWALRKDSPELLKALNKWMTDKKFKSDKITLYNKYFINKKAAEERVNSEFCSMNGGKISVYDHIFKTCSRQLDWDWRLLASMCYQESHFDTAAHSWAGANGLMQLVPATAVRFGGDSVIASPVKNIQAGANFLFHLNNYWKNYIDNKEERIKFVLASYNVGLGHVIDARNLAIKYDKKPNEWTNSVDFYLLNKSKQKYYMDNVVRFGYCRGEEPYNYVKNILNRYEHYKNVIPYKDDVFASAK